MEVPVQVETRSAIYVVDCAYIVYSTGSIGRLQVNCIDLSIWVEGRQMFVLFYEWIGNENANRHHEQTNKAYQRKKN